MVGRFQTPKPNGALLPGKPADYIGTQILDGSLAALLEDPDVILSVMNDDAPIPTTEAREGYFDARHLEFWLSGLRDTRKVMAAAGLHRDSAPAILDFGGASGRVVRHMAREMPHAKVMLCDINRRHIALVKETLGDRVTAFPVVGGAHLPFADHSVDIITAFSVFTHFYDEDYTWLLEFQRVLKPGGLVYATVHDSDTWRRLPNLWFLSDLCFSNADFKRYYDEHPELTERVVHFYNDANDYNCNTFHPESYIHERWGRLFDILMLSPAAHDHQAAVMLQNR